MKVRLIRNANITGTSNRFNTSSTMFIKGEIK